MTQMAGIYKALVEDGDFRYLVLQPGHADEKLVCTLHIANLYTAPSFEAISYVWGSDVKNHEITCNGQPVSITTNLRAALLRVRDLLKPRRLWVDSICINQNDMEERSQQVSLMAQIYSLAERVLAHVGTEDKGHADAVSSLLNEIGGMIQETLATLDSSWNCFSFPDKKEQEKFTSDERLQSLKALTTTPWFNRGWVVQEVALAKEASILWGNVELSWHVLMQCYIWFLRRTSVDWTYFGNLSDVHAYIYEERHHLEAKPFLERKAWSSLELWQILRHARLLSVKDERDILYAFIPLFNSIVGPKATISWEGPCYTKDYLEVYSDFACGYISSTSDLAILQSVQHTEDSINDHRIASWVPRWNIANFNTYVSHATSPILTPAFSGNKEAWCKPYLLGTDTLVVEGVIFDNVQSRSDPLKEADTIDTILSIWKKIGENLASSPYSASYATLAFMWTLCVGIWWGEPEEWKTQCGAYIGCLEGRGLSDNNLESFQNQVKYYAKNRRLIVTDRGYFGMAPLAASVGDVCAVIFGAKTPMLLRETSQKGRYKVIGEMWISGKAATPNYAGLLTTPLLGREGSKDWVELGLEEQEIHLC